MKELNLELLEKLGKFTHELRIKSYDFVKEGAKVSDVIDFVEKSIFEKGYLPAFPCTVCINDMAAHLTVFDEEKVFEKGDVVKIDFGVSKDGFITDNAYTVEIGTSKYKDLMDANLKGLNAVMEKVNVGVAMSELGKTVHDIAVNAGFETIHNLSGHQIANNNLHCGLSVPNFDNTDSRVVEENMELAIEPFFTIGSPRVKSAGNSNILHLQSDKPVRDPFAKKVLMFIRENFAYLPFSKRWLVKEVRENLGLEGGFDKRKVLYALRVLKAQGIIYEYDALATVDGAIVSQFEDAVVFANGKKSIITRL